MKQFFISMIRIIKKNPLINLINLWGFVFGFVCVIFITLWILNEQSYDSFHKNSKNIFRVHRYFYDSNGVENLHLPFVAPVIAPLLKNEYPEIQYISRVRHTDLVFTSGDQKFVEQNVCFAEPDILKIFDFEGLPLDKNLLSAPFTVIISQDEANKYFHGNDVIGKNLEFKDYKGEKYSLQVTGTFKNWKGNNHFNPDFFISFSTFESFVGKEELEDWGSNNYETFALIPHLTSGFDSKLDEFIDKYLNWENASKGTKIRLEKLTDIHFNWYTSRSYIYILTSIAFFILLMASINFMNLNAVIYSKRIKEIKIRKILGASRNKLAFSLLVESTLFCLFSLLLALYIVPVLSEFIKISDNPLELNFMENMDLIIGFVVLSVITGFLSGIYPLFILSSYKPTITNTAVNIKTGKTSFRNTLVVFQFIISTVLIISFFVSFQAVELYR
jgi:putative ABC transport system permease protein